MSCSVADTAENAVDEKVVVEDDDTDDRDDDGERGGAEDGVDGVDDAENDENAAAGRLAVDVGPTGGNVV